MGFFIFIGIIFVAAFIYHFRIGYTGKAPEVVIRHTRSGDDICSSSDGRTGIGYDPSDAASPSVLNMALYDKYNRDF